MRQLTAVLLCLGSLPLFAQTSEWSLRTRIELRGNFRDSDEAKFALRFPFPPSFLPVGQTKGFEQTVDPGSHAELSVAQIRLDANYGTMFAAHAQVHVQDMYRRNPTSEDKRIDADELWLRFGPKPDFLERPPATSFFLQMGKFPKVERQPTRLLESYGLAATAFNRFEDVGFLTGGTIGRNLYWRFQTTSGNPLYFRDPNALAGDNGIKELLQPNPDPHLKSGFPILYNTETEGYSLKTEHLQVGEAIGYRWQNDAQTFGYDAVVCHYKRSMSDTEDAPLTGTFYGVDIDLLEGPLDKGIAISGNNKEEWAGRVYTEWHALTATLQFTSQDFAGLHRKGEEAELGYRFALSNSWVPSIQPAIRWSGLQNDFKGDPTLYPAPSIWWNWIKIDYGVRIGLPHGSDLTVEHAKHNVASPKPVHPDETLVTLRIRI
jgi:hypothetical protein